MIITSTSLSSVSIFPNNSITNFVHKLPSPIHLDVSRSYSIALRSISIHFKLPNRARRIGYIKVHLKELDHYPNQANGRESDCLAKILLPHQSLENQNTLQTHHILVDIPLPLTLPIVESLDRLSFYFTNEDNTALEVIGGDIPTVITSNIEEMEFQDKLTIQLNPAYSNDTHPTNRNDEFTTLLPSSLKFEDQEWEAALYSIIVPPKVIIINEYKASFYTHINPPSKQKYHKTPNPPPMHPKPKPKKPPMSPKPKPKKPNLSSMTPRPGPKPIPTNPKPKKSKQHPPTTPKPKKPKPHPPVTPKPKKIKSHPPMTPKPKKTKPVHTTTKPRKSPKHPPLVPKPKKTKPARQPSTPQTIHTPIHQSSSQTLKANQSQTTPKHPPVFQPLEASHIAPTSSSLPTTSSKPKSSHQEANLVSATSKPNKAKKTHKPRNFRLHLDQPHQNRQQDNFQSFKKPVVEGSQRRVLFDFVSFLRRLGLTVNANNNTLKVSIGRGSISSGTLTLNGYLCELMGIPTNNSGNQSFFISMGQSITITNTFKTPFPPTMINQIVAISDVFGESVVGGQMEKIMSIIPCKTVGFYTSEGYNIHPIPFPSFKTISKNRFSSISIKLRTMSGDKISFKPMYQNAPEDASVHHVNDGITFTIVLRRKMF